MGSALRVSHLSYFSLWTFFSFLLLCCFLPPFALVAWLDTCAKDTDTVGGKQGTEAFGPCLCSLGSNLLKGEPRYPLEAQPSF